MEKQVSQAEKLICDDLLTRAKAGQPAILETTLKAGIPLTFRDEEGNFMQKNPDGTTTLLKKSKKK